MEPSCHRERTAAWRIGRHDLLETAFLRSRPRYAGRRIKERGRLSSVLRAASGGLKCVSALCNLTSFPTSVISP